MVISIIHFFLQRNRALSSSKKYNWVTRGNRLRKIIRRSNGPRTVPWGPLEIRFNRVILYIIYNSEVYLVVYFFKCFRSFKCKRITLVSSSVSMFLAISSNGDHKLAFTRSKFYEICWFSQNLYIDLYALTNDENE